MALVGINEDHIESEVLPITGERREGLQDIRDMKLNLIGPGRVLYPGAGEVLLLVVDLEGMKHSARLEGTGHREGAVAGEGAYLKDEAGTDHLHEHPQQLPLQVAAGHAGIVEVEVRGAPEGVQVGVLRLNMGFYVVVETQVKSIFFTFNSFISHYSPVLLRRGGSCRGRSRR